MKLLSGTLLAAVLILTGLFVHRDQESDTLNDQTRTGVAGSFVRLPHGTVHYQLAGPERGRTVVLVHGFSVPYYIWDPTYDELVKKGFRVLRYDLYGRGYSDRPDEVYGPDLYDIQLNALLSQLNVSGAVDLVGLSMGGPIVVTFADRHPGKVRSLTLVDPAYLSGEEPPLQVRAPLIGEYVMDVFIAPSLPHSQVDVFVHPERFPDYEGKYLPQMHYKGFRRALLSTMRNYLTRDDRLEYQQLGKSGLPVLLVWGKSDRTVPFSISKDVLKAVPQAQFYPVDQAAHVPQYEQPEVFNPILIRFLQPTSLPHR